jgi:hypothetical protein
MIPADKVTVETFIVLQVKTKNPDTSGFFFDQNLICISIHYAKSLSI